MTKTLKEILVGARDLINEKGLARQAFEENGCFCTVGAIIKQFEPTARMVDDRGDGPIFSTIVDSSTIVAEAVRALDFDMEYDAFVFNDYSTFEEVIARFDTAIESLA